MGEYKDATCALVLTGRAVTCGVSVKSQVAGGRGVYNVALGEVVEMSRNYCGDVNVMYWRDHSTCGNPCLQCSHLF